MFGVSVASNHRNPNMNSKLRGVPTVWSGVRKALGRYYNWMVPEPARPLKMTTTTASSLAGSSSAEISQTLPVFDDYAMLTLLLRLVVILRNGDGDASIHGFTENAEVAPDCAFEVHEAEFAPLDAVSAILVQDHEVVAAAYLRPEATAPQDITCDDGTIPVTKLDNDAHDEFGFPIEAYADFTKSPLHFLVAANPRSNSGSDDKFHNLQLKKVAPADGLWKAIQKDPLCLLSS
jgi:hypothetical protein